MASFTWSNIITSILPFPIAAHVSASRWFASRDFAAASGVMRTSSPRDSASVCALPRVSPAQSVTYFEWATPADYETLAAADPLLANYLRAFDVTKITEETMKQIQGNRRMLFAAMKGQAGFDFYRGEQGHFTLPRANGNHPSREYVYGEAEKFGYKIV